MRLKEIKEEKKYDLSRLLLLAVVVLTLSLFILATFYGERLGLSADVILDNNSDYTNYSTSEGSCVPKWECAAWEPVECPEENNMQQRVCTDANDCGTDAGRPVEIKNCVIHGPDMLFYVLIAILVASIGVIAAIIASIFLNKKPQSTGVATRAPPRTNLRAPARPGQVPFKPRRF